MNLWVATANRHKVIEIAGILGDEFNIKSLLDIEDFPEIDENGTSYSENALIKARALYDVVKEPVIADDSGLEVDALGGRPGIHSARFSGENATHETNIALLLKELSGVDLAQRSARFRCIIAYIDAAGDTREFCGVLEGHIVDNCSGTNGFGYDPVFVVKGQSDTLAQLSEAQKNEISHRANALKQFKRFLNL